jgi:hypothetical protein
MIQDNNSESQNAQSLQIAVSGCFSYDDFISKLKELGFDIQIVGYNDRDYRFRLEMNSISVSGVDYPLFGRYCGGNYNSCGRSDKNTFNQIDIDNAIKCCSKIMVEEIKSINEIPNYHTCKDYLNQHFGKTKVEKEAIERVFGILKNCYNDIIRSLK